MSPGPEHVPEREAEPRHPPSPASGAPMSHWLAAAAGNQAVGRIARSLGSASPGAGAVLARQHGPDVLDAGLPPGGMPPPVTAPQQIPATPQPATAQPDAAPPAARRTATRSCAPRSPTSSTATAGWS